MYEVTVSDRNAVLRTVIVRRNGKTVGAASLRFIHWLSRQSPEHLDAAQRALVAWYRGQDLPHEEQRTARDCRPAA